MFWTPSRLRGGTARRAAERPCPPETLFPEWTCREAASFENDTLPAFPAGRRHRGRIQRVGARPCRVRKETLRSCILKRGTPRQCFEGRKAGRRGNALSLCASPALRGFTVRTPYFRRKSRFRFFPEETNVLGLRKKRGLPETSAALPAKNVCGCSEKRASPSAAKKRTVPVQHTEGSVAERLVAPFSSRWDTVFGVLPGEAGKAERRRRRSSGAERIPIAFTRRRRMNTTRKWRLWRISAHAQTSPCRRYGHRRRGSISAHAQTGQISRQHQMTRPMTRTLSARSPCKSTLMGEYSGLRLRSTSFPPGRVSTCLM